MSDEVIVSDDGSTDETLNIVRSFNDPRVKIFIQKSCSGLLGHEYATLNFENALKHASGDIIFMSDQDDVWVKNKVEISLKYLNKYDYIVSDAYVTDADLNVISNTRFTKDEKVYFNKYLAVILSTPYQGSCAAFKKCVLERALPFPKGTQSHDRWIGNVAAFYFKYKVIPEKLIYYRRHVAATSSNFGVKTRSYGFLKKITYKLIYIKGLISIYKK